MTDETQDRNSEIPAGWRPSAVGELLRAAGVRSGATKSGEGKSIRQTAIEIGLSHSALADCMRPLAPTGPHSRRRHHPRTLDVIAQRLGISRRELAVAAIRDAAGPYFTPEVNDDADLRAIYDYLSGRSVAEQSEVLGWLAARIAAHSQR